MEWELKPVTVQPIHRVSIAVTPQNRKLVRSLLMKILAIVYGHFPKVFKLYSRFQPKVGHLKVVLDVHPAGGFERAKFLTVFRQLSELFPTISRHACCVEWESAPLYLEEEDGVSIKRAGESADVAHLIEHVIVDMQVNVGSMQQCSGLTCGWKNPENRFDLFVECTDARIGLFSAQFAVYLVSRMLTKKRLSRRNEFVLKLAKFLNENPGETVEVESLSSNLGWKKGNVEMALSRLHKFGFFLADGSEESQWGEKSA